ncbi:MAG: hypothetical protein MJZ84_07565 [Paludibacteraceae bacterium]|nr:hypothetical protein [Paludibacteraceae bacterium]
MNTQSFINDGQKFPLSTESLNFIQEQIKLVYGLTDLAGANVIIKDSTATKDGLVIMDGELLPLKGTHNAYISLVQSKETLSIGDFSENVRTLRVAVYGNSPDSSAIRNVPSSSFSGIKNILTLMDELKEAKKHHMPKGSIIDWYGECKAANIPYGFVPCGWFGVGLTLNEIANELTAWQTKYGANNISISRVNTSGSRLVISSCNGQTVPLLTDRFIVQAGHTYQLGANGGSNAVTLTASQSGLPNNVVDGISKTTGKAYSGTSASQHDCVNTLSYTTKSSHDASASHENRPPYYALYKLIKVI